MKPIPKIMLIGWAASGFWFCIFTLVIILHILLGYGK